MIVKAIFAHAYDTDMIDRPAKFGNPDFGLSWASTSILYSGQYTDATGMARN